MTNSRFFLRCGAAIDGLLIACVLVAAQAWRAPSAHACGGFFCSRAAPVVQAAEEIIFVDNPDDTVTAVIRINYQGPSQKFAWVLPIDGAPSKIEVSSNLAFNSLRTATDPSYTMTTTVEGTCKAEPVLNASAPTASSGSAMRASGSGGSASTAPPVTVIAEGAVGPYDFEVIRVDPNLTDPADVAVKWLTDHGYDITDLGPDVLRPYLAEGLNLMAFKLTKGANATSGSIRPVMLTYNSKLPVIPIRPTAVASQPDMGILVWLVSDHQAVPKNYKALVLNEALINWFSFSTNYRQVVTAAADEAGGQGFVSEMAGDSAQLKNLVYNQGQAQQWTSFSQQTFADGFAAIRQASQYAGWDGYQDAVCASVTLPSGVSCPMFASNPEMYRNMLQVDASAFLTALYQGVIKPVIATQDLLLSRPYFTRMFTTMSPEEMTADPSFDFNPDLLAISNRHTATRVIECDPSVFVAQAPWRVQLPQGGVVYGTGSTWPYGVGGKLPANLKVVTLGTTGGGKVVADNSAMIFEALATSDLAKASKPSMMAAGTNGGGTVTIGAGGAGGTGGGVPIGGVTQGTGGTAEPPDAGAGSTPHLNHGCAVGGAVAVSSAGASRLWLVLACVLLALMRRAAIRSTRSRAGGAGSFARRA